MAANLYGHAWRKRRARQLQLHPLCRMCLDVDARATPATVADHIFPHRGDPVLFAGPLQSLCASCHNSRKQALENGGVIKGCDLQGIPLDPGHPWRIDYEKQRQASGGADP